MKIIFGFSLAAWMKSKNKIRRKGRVFMELLFYLISINDDYYHNH